MSQVYKRLGALQSTGTLTTADQLYVAPTTSGTSTVLSTIAICNRGTTNRTYRLCINSTSAFAAAGYLVYEATVAANDTVFLTLGVTLDPTNRFLLCSASSSEVSFSAFGVENS